MHKLFLIAVGVVAVLVAQAASDEDQDKPPRIFRVILPVTEIDRAVAFYTELLAVEARTITPSRRYLDTGDPILALVDVRADGDRALRPNQEIVYFAVADLDAVFARAARLGGLSKDMQYGAPMGAIATRPWGERSFYMQDPSGNPICFVDETTLFTGRPAAPK